MKTSDLTGVLLDFYVAKAEGHDPKILRKLNSPAGELMWHAETPSGSLSGMRHKFSEQWELAGPIIDREHLSVVFDRPSGRWGCPLETSSGTTYVTGETAMLAAMRAYVASKFGSEVPD